jgi:hypothetical protein
MLIEDPAGGPGGTAPYAVLAAAGVTPWTTQGEMQDVSFELHERGLMSPQTQQAWNDLRSTRRRLLFDLFLYDLGDGPQECGEAAVGAGGPPPVWAARLLDDLIRFDR